MSNFSNTGEGKKIMTNTITEVAYRRPRFHHELQISEKRTVDSSSNSKMKIYTVYNPESNPSFYLHNKIAWYKNFK